MLALLTGIYVLVGSIVAATTCKLTSSDIVSDGTVIWITVGWPLVLTIIVFIFIIDKISDFIVWIIKLLSN